MFSTTWEIYGTERTKKSHATCFKATRPNPKDFCEFLCARRIFAELFGKLLLFLPNVASAVGGVNFFVNSNRDFFIFNFSADSHSRPKKNITNNSFHLLEREFYYRVFITFIPAVMRFMNELASGPNARKIHKFK